MINPDNKQKIIPVCSWCGSSDVVFDGSLSYDPLTDKFEVNGTYDSTDCGACEGECGIEWVWCDDKGSKIVCSSFTEADTCPLCPAGKLKIHKIWSVNTDPTASFMCCDKNDDHVFLIAAYKEINNA